MKKDWFNTHIKIITLDGDKKKEKEILSEIKEACIERWTKQASDVTREENLKEDKSKNEEN